MKKKLADFLRDLANKLDPIGGVVSGALFKKMSGGPGVPPAPTPSPSPTPGSPPRPL